MRIDTERLRGHSFTRAARSGMRAVLSIPSRVRAGLGLKLLLLVVVISLLGMLASTFLVVTLQREEMTNSAREDTARLSRAVEASFAHSMLTGDHVLFQQVIESVTADEGGLHKISVLTTEGRVAISSVPGEVGSQCEWTGWVYRPGRNGRLIPVYGSSIGESCNGEPVLLHATEIRNEPRCYGCHPKSSDTLGVLLTERPLGDVEDQVNRAVSLMVLPALATFVLLVGLLTPALNQLVTRPVLALRRAAVQFGRGDLDHSIEIKRSDELGELAHAFDTMRLQLQASHAEMEQRNRELALLNRVAAVAASQSLDLQPVLELALTAIVDSMGLQAGMILLDDRETGRTVLRAQWGLSDSQHREITERLDRQDGELPGASSRDSLTTLIADVAHHAGPFAGWWHDDVDRAYAGISLRSQSTVLGTLGVFTRGGQALSERELRVLEAAASAIGIAVDNALLLAGTRRREQEATAIYLLGAEISASLDLPRVLDAVATGARQLLRAETGFVGLSDDAQGEITLRAVSGPGAEALQGLSVPIAEGCWGHALTLGKPVVIADGPVAWLTHGDGGVKGGPERMACLAIPLERGEHLRGLLGVVDPQTRSFTNADVEMLARLVQHVVTAIDNARLYQQARYLAVLEERDRLGREMHDNLAQALGYINLKSAITHRLLEEDRYDEAETSLLDLKQVAQESYDDVRESIFSLRTAASLEMGILPMLRAYLPEYRVHYGVDAQLLVDDESQYDFPATTEVQLTRIVQEALTNIRKHSDANKAWIGFDRNDGHARITIRDNGCGFDPDQVATGGGHHLGLQIMRERAEAVGGRLEIASQPGAGTTVQVLVPCSAED